MSKKLPPATGNKVCFVGGPEAGNVRIIPESAGEYFQEGDWIYRLIPFKLDAGTGKNRSGSNSSATMYFAFAANQHPLTLLRDMWREYSPAAQIKRGSEIRTYQRAGRK